MDMYLPKSFGRSVTFSHLKRKGKHLSFYYYSEALLAESWQQFVVEKFHHSLLALHHFLFRFRTFPATSICLNFLTTYDASDPSLVSEAGAIHALHFVLRSPENALLTLGHLLDLNRQHLCDIAARFTTTLLHYEG